MTRAQQLTEYGPVYFDHVIAQFDLYKKEENEIPPYVREIIDKSQKTPELLAWKDVYALEEFVLEIQPPEVAKARASGLEQSYSDLTGGKPVKTALQSGEAIKPILARILDSLHWIYSMVPVREQMRSDILKQSGIWILGSSAVLLPVSIAFALKGHTLFAILPLVALMGALGGFVSLQRRIANIPTDQDPLVTMIQLQNGRFSITLAPFLGAVFALVLFLIFTSGLLKESIFPEAFKFGSWKLLQDPINDAVLMNTGKLLLWSFIAGFAESFVPDTLNSIVAQGKRQESQSRKNTRSSVDETAAASSQTLENQQSVSSKEPDLNKVKNPALNTNGHGRGAK